MKEVAAQLQVFTHLPEVLEVIVRILKACGKCSQIQRIVINPGQVKIPKNVTMCQDLQLKCSQGILKMFRLCHFQVM